MLNSCATVFLRIVYGIILLQTTYGYNYALPLKRYLSNFYPETIFVVGGANENGDDLLCGEYYTSAVNKWSDISPMKQPRSGNAAVSCRGDTLNL